MSYTLGGRGTLRHIDVTAIDDGRSVESKGVFSVRAKVLILKVGKVGHRRPDKIDFVSDEGNVDYFVLGKVHHAAKSSNQLDAQPLRRPSR